MGVPRETAATSAHGGKDRGRNCGGPPSQKQTFAGTGNDRLPLFQQGRPVIKSRRYPSTRREELSLPAVPRELGCIKNAPTVLTAGIQHGEGRQTGAAGGVRLMVGVSVPGMCVSSAVVLANPAKRPASAAGSSSRAVR